MPTSQRHLPRWHSADGAVEAMLRGEPPAHFRERHPVLPAMTAPTSRTSTVRDLVYQERYSGTVGADGWMDIRGRVRRASRASAFSYRAKEYRRWSIR